MVVGEKVRRLRLERGWSQAELSTHARIALNVVAKIEQDYDGTKADVRMSSLMSLARVFGKTLSEFLEGIDGIPSQDWITETKARLLKPK
jgi:transcriptional regulator with XRE-family HTH domain